MSIEKVTLICLSCAAVASVGLMGTAIALNCEQNTTVAAAEVTISDEKEIYILKDFNGKLALFGSYTDEPIEVFDIYTSSFGEYDRELLSHGITADSREKINAVIEDYTS